MARSGLMPTVAPTDVTAVGQWSHQEMTGTTRTIRACDRKGRNKCVVCALARAHILPATHATITRRKDHLMKE
jgi:hypothetical protein